MNDLGKISIFLNAIGKIEGNKEILPAIALVAGNFELEEFNIENHHSVYYKFFSKGVEFCFIENKLNSIIFFIEPHEKYLGFKFDDDFIYGLKNTSNKNDILIIMGTPDSKGVGISNWIKYSFRDKNIHFEFNKHLEIRKISVF